MIKIVFQHIPKCAGTSINKEISRNFHKQDICPEKLNNLENFSAKELNSYNYFSGHYDSWRIGLIPGPKFVFTFLRDPQERIISLFNFWQM